MWPCENPLGEGHPDEEDDRFIRKLVSGVLKKTETRAAETVALSDLAYQPEKVHNESVYQK